MSFPDQLVCYQCGELLHRSTRLTVGDGLVIWILAMLPLGAFFTLGGVAGLVVGSALLLILVPMRFWEGFRYTLVAREPNALPPARVVEPVGSSATNPTPDRGADPHRPGGEEG